MSFPPELPLRLVIFDCDGVLVDSEGPSNRALAEEISKLGWPMDEAESTRRFVGCQLRQITPVVEAHLGRPVPDGWVELLRSRLVDVLAQEVERVPGVLEALAALDSLGVPYRVASNSSQAEMRVKFLRTGLERLLPRSHSAYDVPRAKPAPDVFLAAAAAEGVPPGACLVVEDSVTGATGAAAAGMSCVGYVAPGGSDAGLRRAGATVISSLSELPGLFQVAARLAA